MQRYNHITFETIVVMYFNLVFQFAKHLKKWETIEAEIQLQPLTQSQIESGYVYIDYQSF